MRVALFITCVNDTLYPRTGQAVVTLLERLGVEVDFPRRRPAAGSRSSTPATGTRPSRWPAATPMSSAATTTIVTPVRLVRGDGAGATIRGSARGRRRGPRGRTRRAAAPVVPKTYELTEFLVDVLGVTDVGAYYPHTVTYHPTCHGLRDAGPGRPAAPAAARRSKGLELVELPGAEECCGFGGTFAVKNADVSAAMGADKVRNAEATGAEVLCAADNSCLMHIGGTLTRRGSAVRPVHIAEILASTEEEPLRVSGHVSLGMPVLPAGRRTTPSRNTTLRGNLRHATHTIRAKRAAGRRGAGRLGAAARGGQAAIKDRTLRHLDHYLEQLEEAVTAAGGTVHWAADADEANRIVTDLVQATGETRGRQGQVDGHAGDRPQRGAGEAEGIPAYETDLAELIVQFGDDLPSHILVPAIHRNRGEIRDIFRARDGRVGPPGARRASPTTPAELAEAARLHLREKFLRAKVGISGANFMVAETGTLVVVESEGNGRMCLTLPETLISVVGIEKVVPTWRDLEVFLQTLPRSSTAERMNPYTSMWTGTTDGDGPRDLPPGPARQRPHRRPRRRGRPPGAALHPLLGLPERLPGVRAGRRPRLRLGLSRPDRRHPQPPTPRHAERDRRLAAVRLLAVRRLLRGVPGRHRHPRGAGPPAGTGRRGRRRSPGTGNKVVLKPAKGHAAERAAMRAARWAFEPPGRPAHRPAAGRPAPAASIRGTLPGPGRAWSDTRDLPPVPAEPFRDWWQRTATAERGQRTARVSSRDVILGRVRPRARRRAARTTRPYEQAVAARLPARARRPRRAEQTVGPARREPGGLPGDRAPLHGRTSCRP